MNQDFYIPVLTAVFSSGISYYAATVIHKFDKTYKRKEKALEMANEFSKLISSRSFDVSSINKKVLENIGLQEKVLKLETEIYLDFDKDELNDFFNQEEVKRYQEYQSVDNIEFIKILFLTFRDGTFLEECLSATIMEFDNNLNLQENINKKEDGWVYSTAERKIIITNNDIVQAVNSMYKKYNETAIYSINRLEWFAMYFTNNIADERSVYQSLHQVYLKTVISQYIDISLKNQTGHEKYFVNLIELYNSWNEKKQKIKNKTNKRIQANRNSFQKPKKLK